MLTYEDCLAFCELSEEEIAAISEHELIPEIVAIEMGEYLVHTDDGERRISRMILEDIEKHNLRNDNEGVERLQQILRHFIVTHPKAQNASKTGPGKN